MSETLNEIILSTEPQFRALDSANGNLLDYKQECLFARQQITKNDYTTKTAADNPGSLRSAILNVSAIGISLNPALSHAYLVPRDGKICLDISYRGLVKLATDVGAIQWAKTELVYQNDAFVWNGPNKEPEHKADPFSDRGDVVGGYCLAKLPDGSFMVETMTRAEMDKIQATSKAGNGPWKHWPDEMRKKTVTKRASKSWPQSGGRGRVDTAISVLNEHEGDRNIATPETPADVVLVPAYTQDERDEFQRCINHGDYYNLFALKRSLSVDAQAALYDLCIPKAEHGKKGAAKKELAEKLADAERRVDASIDIIRESLDAGDDGAAYEIIETCSQWTLDYIMERLSPEHQSQLNQVRAAA